MAHLGNRAKEVGWKNGSVFVEVDLIGVEFFVRRTVLCSVIHDESTVLRPISRDAAHVITPDHAWLPIAVAKCPALVIHRVGEFLQPIFAGCVQGNSIGKEWTTTLPNKSGQARQSNGYRQVGMLTQRKSAQ